MKVAYKKLIRISILLLGMTLASNLMISKAWSVGGACSDGDASNDPSDPCSSGSSGTTIPGKVPLPLELCHVEQSFLTGAASCSAPINQCNTQLNTCVQKICGTTVPKEITKGNRHYKYLEAQCPTEAARNKALSECGINSMDKDIENACAPGCGNNILEAGEYCDGTDNPNGGQCSTTCHSACGDGKVTTGSELCDPNIPGGDPNCNADCTLKSNPNTPMKGAFPDEKPICGNGKLEIFEECDPSGETCNAKCQFIPSVAVDYGCFKDIYDTCKQSNCSLTGNQNLLCKSALNSCLLEAQNKCEKAEPPSPKTGGGPTSSNLSPTPSPSDSHKDSSAASESGKAGCSLATGANAAGSMIPSLVLMLGFIPLIARRLGRLAEKNSRQNWNESPRN
ncbi:MAG: hypothetical protein U1F66_00845 [bacterium]